MLEGVQSSNEYGTIGNSTPCVSLEQCTGIRHSPHSGLPPVFISTLTVGTRPRI